MSGTAVDAAGNEASVTLSGINVDSGGPLVETIVSPPPNEDGWNAQPVTVTFECTDVTSGVATCPDPLTFDTEGPNQSATALAGDVAGNETSVDTPIVSVDLTAPSATVTGVEDGAVFDTGEGPTPGCMTTARCPGCSTTPS